MKNFMHALLTKPKRHTLQWRLPLLMALTRLDMTQMFTKMQSSRYSNQLLTLTEYEAMRSQEPLAQLPVLTVEDVVLNTYVDDNVYCGEDYN